MLHACSKGMLQNMGMLNKGISDKEWNDILWIINYLSGILGLFWEKCFVRLFILPMSSHQKNSNIAFLSETRTFFKLPSF